MTYILVTIAIALTSSFGLIILLYPLVKTRSKTTKVMREKSSNSLMGLNKLIITISSAIIAITVNLKLSSSIHVDFKTVWILFLCSIILSILSYFLDFIRKLYDELLIRSAEKVQKEKDDRPELKSELKSNLNQQATYQTIVYILIYLQYVSFISGMIITISKGFDI